MKKLFLLVTLLSLFQSCELIDKVIDDIFGQDTTPPNKFSQVCNPQLRVDSVTYDLSYNCYEVLVDATGADGQRKLDWLLNRGFRRVDSCSCNPKLQLWTIDTVGMLTTDNPTPTKGKVNGEDYVLNYIIDFAEGANNERYSDVDSNDIKTIPHPERASSTVTVAIIDTGIDFGYTGFAGYIWQNPSPGTGCVQQDYNGFNFGNPLSPQPIDRNRHGTFVSGIVTGNSKRPEDHQGVQIKVMPLKFTDETSGRGTLFDGVCAMYYAIQNGAKVINLSWGYESPSAPAIMKPVLAEAKHQGVLVVAAAGNDASDNDAKHYWPAGFSTYPEYNVIAVAGLNEPETNLGSYTNFGKSSVTLAAPGESIVSARLGGGAIALTGTSAATPIVSRTAAIIMGSRGMSAEDVKGCLSGGLLLPLSSTPWPPALPIGAEKDIIASGGKWHFGVSPGCR